MSQVLRISLPGYDALTDTNPDHFALYADQNWILIKEKERGSTSLKNTESYTITHSLGYVPVVFVYQYVNKYLSYWNGSENLEFTHTGWSIPRMASPTDVVPIFASATTSTVDITANTTSTPIPIKYFLFYDQQL